MAGPGELPYFLAARDWMDARLLLEHVLALLLGHVAGGEEQAVFR